MKLTALNKLLNFPAFLSGKWVRCKGGLYGNEEYETCRAENSPWMPIQTRGEFGNSNKARAANKSPQTAAIAFSDVLSFVFHLNKLHAPQGKVRIRKVRIRKGCKGASVAGSASSSKSASVVLPLFPFPSIAVSNFENLNLDFES